MLMIIVLFAVTVLIMFFINKYSIESVDSHSKAENDNKNFLYGIKRKAKRVVSTTFDKKFLFKKNNVLSLLFAIISAVGVCFVVHFSNDVIAIIRYSVIILALSPISIIDCYKKKIFNKAVVVLALFRVILFIPEYFYYNQTFKDHLISSFIGLGVGFALLIILYAISRGGLGMGDVKIISVLGFYTGIASMFYTLVLGMICCFFYCLYLITIKKKDKKYKLPFGPFILIGLVMSLLVNWC